MISFRRTFSWALGPQILLPAGGGVVLAVAIAGCGPSRSGEARVPGADSSVEAAARPMVAPRTVAPTTAPGEAPRAAEVTVEIDNFAFKPSKLVVAPGTRITWVNRDDVPHTATSTTGIFNSKGLDTDDRFSFVFASPGEYPYFCAVHPHMTATVVVQPSAQ